MFWRLTLWNKTGAKAEALALKFLKARGLKLVTRNYACRFGEIDLIMLDGTVLVFIEVRARADSRMGSAAESITPAKQKKIRFASSHFLTNHKNHQHRSCRFDAITVNNSKSNDDETTPNPIEWFPGAF